MRPPLHGIFGIGRVADACVAGYQRAPQRVAMVLTGAGLPRPDRLVVGTALPSQQGRLWSIGELVDAAEQHEAERLAALRRLRLDPSGEAFAAS